MPACRLILSPTWEVSRKDSHLTEEDTKAQGGHREGREERPGERDQDSQPTSAWPVCSNSRLLCYQHSWGALLQVREGTHSWGYWPWFPAVLPSKPLLKCLGQGERQPCRQKGRETGSYRERRGPVGQRCGQGTAWQQNTQVPECQGQRRPLPVGSGKKEKLQAGEMVTFAVLYWGRPGLTVVAALHGGQRQGGRAEVAGQG